MAFQAGFSNLIKLAAADLRLSTTNAEIHAESCCDNCRQHPILGPRWRCDTCDDYDLCGDCHTRRQTFHKPHTFTRKFPPGTDVAALSVGHFAEADDSPAPAHTANATTTKQGALSAVFSSALGIGTAAPPEPISLESLPLPSSQTRAPSDPSSGSYRTPPSRLHAPGPLIAAASAALQAAESAHHQTHERLKALALRKSVVAHSADLVAAQIRRRTPAAMGAAGGSVGDASADAATTGPLGVAPLAVTGSLSLMSAPSAPSEIVGDDEEALASAVATAAATMPPLALRALRAVQRSLDSARADCAELRTQVAQLEAANRVLTDDVQLLHARAARGGLPSDPSGAAPAVVGGAADAVSPHHALVAGVGSAVVGGVLGLMRSAPATPVSVTSCDPFDPVSTAAQHQMLLQHVAALTAQVDMLQREATDVRAQSVATEQWAVEQAGVVEVAHAEIAALRDQLAAAEASRTTSADAAVRAARVDFDRREREWERERRRLEADVARAQKDAASAGANGSAPGTPHAGAGAGGADAAASKEKDRRHALEVAHLRKKIEELEKELATATDMRVGEQESRRARRGVAGTGISGGSHSDDPAAGVPPYLRNVFVRFLESDSHKLRYEMLPAIATVLQLTPPEMGSVLRVWKP